MAGNKNLKQFPLNFWLWTWCRGLGIRRGFWVKQTAPQKTLRFFWLHLHKLSLLLTSHWKMRGGNAALPWEHTLNKPAVLVYHLAEKQKNSERIPYPGGKNCTASQTQRGCIRDHRTSTCFKNKRVFCGKIEALGLLQIVQIFLCFPLLTQQREKTGTCPQVFDSGRNWVWKLINSYIKANFRTSFFQYNTADVEEVFGKTTLSAKIIFCTFYSMDFILRALQALRYY